MIFWWKNFRNLLTAQEPPKKCSSLQGQNRDYYLYSFGVAKQVVGMLFLGFLDSVTATTRAERDGDMFRGRLERFSGNRDVVTRQVRACTFRSLQSFHGGHFCLGKLDVEGSEILAMKSAVGAPPFLVMEGHLKEIADHLGISCKTLLEKRAAALVQLRRLLRSANCEILRFTERGNFDPLLFCTRVKFSSAEQTCENCMARRAELAN